MAGLIEVSYDRVKQRLPRSIKAQDVTHDRSERMLGGDRVELETPGSGHLSYCSVHHDRRV
jgi:hypothetical protein